MNAGCYTKTVSKTLVKKVAEPLPDMLAETLLKVVANTNADTLTCVEAEALVKTETDTFAGVEVCLCLGTLNKLKLRHCSMRKLTRFHWCRPKVLPKQ